MKTVVTIPDDVFAEAERLAKRLKMSRNRLFTRALVEYMARKCADDVTQAMDRVLNEVGEETDEFLLGATRRRLKPVEW